MAIARFSPTKNILVSVCFLVAIENYALSIPVLLVNSGMFPPETEIQSIITGLQKLGPEPFAADFSLDYFVDKLSNRRRHIKTLLLDQSIVAGIGNIYADEALFKSGISPSAIAINLNARTNTETTSSNH